MKLAELERKLSSKIRFEDVMVDERGDLTILMSICNGITTAFATFSKDASYAGYKPTCPHKEEQKYLSELIGNNLDFETAKELFYTNMH